MRARFSAFALGDEAYLVRSWDPATRPAAIRLDPDRAWERLEVLATTGGGLLDAEGTVEFRAHHRQGTDHGVLHERSRFVRHDGQWVYEGPDGSIRGARTGAGPARLG